MASKTVIRPIWHPYVVVLWVPEGFLFCGEATISEQQSCDTMNQSGTQGLSGTFVQKISAYAWLPPTYHIMAQLDGNCYEAHCHDLIVINLC